MAAEGLDLSTIINGGSTGIAVLLILYMAWKDRLSSHEEVARTNQLAKVLEGLSNNAAENNKQIAIANNNHANLVSVLDRNTRAHQKMTEALDRNSRVLDRVERFMEKTYEDGKA